MIDCIFRCSITEFKLLSTFIYIFLIKNHLNIKEYFIDFTINICYVNLLISIKSDMVGMFLIFKLNRKEYGKQ